MADARKPYSLSPIGQEIVRRGGADGQSQDDLVVLELVSRAPGMTPMEYQQCFISIMEEYGEDALFAIRNGYVKFEEVRGGSRQEREGETQ
jgi:hypothetical protein